MTQGSSCTHHFATSLQDTGGVFASAVNKDHKNG